MSLIIRDRTGFVAVSIISYTYWIPPLYISPSTEWAPSTMRRTEGKQGTFRNTEQTLY